MSLKFCGRSKNVIKLRNAPEPFTYNKNLNWFIKYKNKAQKEKERNGKFH